MTNIAYSESQSSNVSDSEPGTAKSVLGVDQDTQNQNNVRSTTHAQASDRPVKTADIPKATSEVSRKLPYQPIQQVKFLNLQAETEALLQQLYLMQHRRQLGEPQPSLQSAKQSGRG